MSLAKSILNQTTLYNGHGQMEISEMKIKKLYKLLRKLEELKLGSSFTLEIWGDSSGSIYEVTSLSDADRRLWFSVDKITGLE